MFKAEMIAHSLSDNGDEVITMQLQYPRFIHAEFMTHREFSRNASSSRAIPVMKMIEQVRNDPAMPIHWGANQPGMQAHAELEGENAIEAQELWRMAANNAADIAYEMQRIGLHKQVANRPLEPFQWMHVIMTTSKLSNFFGLRNHPDAQPEIKHLAGLMYDCYQSSVPKSLHRGEWHLPYIKEEDWVAAYGFLKIGRITRDEPSQKELQEVLKKASVARCARVSYLTHEGKVPELQADLDLFVRLAGATPIHASPLEHQATPDSFDEFDGWAHPELHGNLNGWKQFRKQVEGEYIS